MKLSYVIVSYNRRDTLLRTLDILHSTTPLPRDQWEVWLVDNASTDGTCFAVAQQFPDVRIMRRRTNEGVWARSYAFGGAQGQYIILLDDDSYPIGDAVTRSITYMETNAKCAAVVGRVVLPDDSCEACAFPAVMLSGAVCLRHSVLEKIGGFAREFFRKAGEYDFSFRVWEAGYTVERLEDVVYRHDKSPAARSASLSHRMDLRNNLILAERYLPAGLRRAYREDWSMRYTALARHAGCASAARRARWEGRLWRVREALRGRRTLSPATVETIFRLSTEATEIGHWAHAHGVRKVVIADMGKNLYATYRGCTEAGLEVVAIADSNPAYAGLRYRGVPILEDEAAFATGAEGVVISNINPAQVDRVEQRVRSRFIGPVLRLWEPQPAQNELQIA